MRARNKARRRARTRASISNYYSFTVGKIDTLFSSRGLLNKADDNADDATRAAFNYKCTRRVGSLCQFIEIYISS